MRRLVYTPRVYAYIKDVNGNIRDVSRYITAGSVSRKLNQVSTAELSLRNPKMFFTTPDDKGRVAFHPMDPITIYLKRIRNRPVRVFTGFLDKTPYITLFPGTVTLRASCTLKRLLYTYFDPALPYTQSFLKAYGWLNNNGTVFSTSGFQDQVDPEADGSKAAGDGSVAELLYATLKHIGNWTDDTIQIEKLPKDLFTRMATLYQEISDDNEQLKSEVESLLSRIIGEGDYGAAGGASDPAAATGTVRGLNRIIPKMVQIADKYGIPARMVIATWQIEWGGLKDTPGNKHYGWFQMQTENPPYAYGPFSKRAPTLKETHDLGIATDAYCAAAAGWVQANPSLRNNLLEWTMKVQGVNGQNNPLYPQTWNKMLVWADDQISFHGSPTGSQDSSAIPLDQTTRATRRDGRPNKSGTGTNKLFSAIKGLDPDAGIGGGGRAYGASREYGGHAGVDATAAMGTTLYAICDGVITYAGPWGSEGKLVLLKATQQIDGYPANIRLGYGHMSVLDVKAGDQVTGGTPIGKSGAGSNGQPHLHFFVRTDDTPANGTMDPTALLQAAARGEQPTGSGGSSSSNTDAGGAFAGDSSAANALVAQFNFPTFMESLEAVALQGEKSLMNDKPLLPFIQQLAEASLREFQSLPDGKFFAFHPDYFGEMFHRPPYWEIDDIEVLDGKIELSDDAVVTHSYVVGDTTWPSTNESLNRIFSAGTITIFNVFMSESILNRPADSEDKPGREKLLDKNQGIAFLKRYGARPLVEEMPMVHSPYFEMFLAYQRFLLAWSKQFSTPFSFTFMPELYPGGKVGFPDHGLQMYIEDVTHSFDYTSGFSTQATLSAPSVYNGDSKTASQFNLPPNMVNAIIDTVSN